MKFNQKLPRLAKIIRDNLHVLKLTPESKKMYNSQSLFVSYKMERNLKSLIFKNKYIKMLEPASNVDETTENSHCFFSCSKCTFCKKFLIETNSFISANISNTFYIKSHISCHTENVILLCYT